MSTSVEVSSRLRAERERLGLKQEELAARLEVSRTTQSNYERGERSPDTEYMARAAALGIDVQYVVTGLRTAARAGDAAGLGAVLTREESALLDNYRHSSAEGRRAIAAAGAALAQPAAPLKPTGSGGS